MRYSLVYLTVIDYTALSPKLLAIVVDDDSAALEFSRREIIYGVQQRYSSCC
jgi:hypothetical protein